MTRFSFTVTDAARFLGKSPATIRAWDRTGFISLPRRGVERRLDADKVLHVAVTAYKAGRISMERLRMVTAVVSLINLIEGDND